LLGLATVSKGWKSNKLDNDDLDAIQLENESNTVDF
jgi:hypothetical protein